MQCAAHRSNVGTKYVCKTYIFRVTQQSCVSSIRTVIVDDCKQKVNAPKASLIWRRSRHAFNIIRQDATTVYSWTKRRQIPATYTCRLYAKHRISTAPEHATKLSVSGINFFSATVLEDVGATVLSFSCRFACSIELVWFWLCRT